MTDASPSAPVDCASCGHANPAGSKFCGECGGSLAPQEACGNCGSSNPVGQRFCNGCGAALNAPDDRPAPERGAAPVVTRPVVAAATAPGAERKQVSVLFCDVSGSMRLAEQSDPEQWREVMDGLFQRLSEAVRDFGGTVDKFTGDGLMALFGAPLAQEDHAERACHAALTMLSAADEFAERVRAERGIELAVRVGVSSGEVVAGEIGGAESGDGYTAVGHTVGLAQRMESLARPGTVNLTEQTAALVDGHFKLEDLGPTEVKGSSEPIRIFRLTGESGIVDDGVSARSETSQSKLVGREHELAQLSALLDRAIDGGGGVVAIVGEPGVGKSRISRELVSIGEARGASVCQARCQSHTTNVPLMPTRQLMRSYFGIPLEATDHEARETIRDTIAEIDPRLTEDLDVFFEFLAIPDPERDLQGISAEARRRRLFHLMRSVVRSRNIPVVSVVEDLHWIDPASEAVLEAYADAIKGTSTLLVTNFRPEYEGRLAQRPELHRVPLRPLGEKDVSGLLSELLGDDPSLDGLAERISERTEGNPFFTEEMVRELAGSGVLEGERGAYRLKRQLDDLPLPPSVQTVLSARIDRLAPRSKAVLCAAAVAGNEFRFDLLRSITGLDEDALDAALDDLLEREFVDQTEFHPEAAYVFHHPLTREVAYGTQLSSARAAMHVKVAESLQELHPEQLEEHAALIAQHYETAGEIEKAIEWHARAAAWLGFNDANAAFATWQHVRELSDGLDADCDAGELTAMTSRLMVLMHGWRISMPKADARDCFEEGLAIAKRREDVAVQALFHVGMGVAAGMSYGNTTEYVRHGDEAVRLAMTIDDPAARAAILTGPLHARSLAARYDDAIALSDELIAATGGDPRLGGGLTVASPLSVGYSFRALPLARLGRIAEAREWLAKGLETSREHDSECYFWSLCFAFMLASSGADDGDDDLLAMLDEAVELAQSHGDHFSVLASLWWSGAVKMTCGDYEAALADLNEYVAVTDSEEYQQVSMDRSVYARTLLALGDPDGAIADVESVLEMIGRSGCINMVPAIRAVEASARSERRRGDDLELAEQAIAEGERYALAAGARLDMVELAIARAHLARALDGADAYATALDAAEAGAREIDAQGHLRTIARLRGQEPASVVV